MKLLITLSTIIGLSQAIAIPEEYKADTEVSETNDLARRDPSDKSGNSQFVLNCEGVTVPYTGGANGEGEGGAGYFYSNMVFNAQGTKIEPVACTELNPTCNTCLFSGGGLSSDTNVTSCWNPPAGRSGCSIEFSYNGYDYDSQNEQPYCGHQSGFEPFSFDLSAICYFNV